MRQATRLLLLSCASLGTGALAAPAAKVAPTPPSGSATARQFGARENVSDISLSPDGRFIAYIAASAGTGNEVRTLDTASGRTVRVLTASGKPLRFTSCGWASSARLVCKLFARAEIKFKLTAISRTVAVNWDGTNRKFLSGLAGKYVDHQTQYDGDVVDWNAGNSSILIAHDWNNTSTTEVNYVRGFHVGFGVDRVNTLSATPKMMEAPNNNASLLLADGMGNIRVRGIDEFDDGPDNSKPDPADPRQQQAAKARTLNVLSIDPDADLYGDDSMTDDTYADDSDAVFNGTTDYQYRAANSHKWLPLSKVTTNEGGFFPIAVDGGRNYVYGTQALNGFTALYRVKMTGSTKPELVSSNPAADVTGVIRIGDDGHVIGATYNTIVPTIDYFDPVYKDLAAGLSQQLPGNPTVRFVSTDAKERKMVVLISSATDPGHYDIYDSEARSADNWLNTRPTLEGTAIAPTTHISFKAPAGNMVEATLTMPPGGATRGLPAIVLARGGGEYRDLSGFDWIAQYFAQLGYAVIQPSLRSSEQVDDKWYTLAGSDRAAAVADARNAAHWLIAQGIADPRRMAAMGWSWGGYTALESSVVEPDLFKAVVTIAAVTHVPTGPQVIASSADMVTEDDVVAGSPVRDAARIKAPVLMFHGDSDLDVDVKYSRDLDAALQKAGKKPQLVIFPKLDHELIDSDARAQLLDRSTAFLHTAMDGPRATSVIATGSPG